MISISDISKAYQKKERFDGFGGIGSGRIFAAEPLLPPSRVNTLIEYQKGVDVFSVDGSNGWLANGHNDTMPDLQRLLYRRSSIHNSCVNIIASLIAGLDFEFYDLKEYMVRGKDGRFEVRQTGFSPSQFEAEKTRAKLFVKNTGLGHYRRDASQDLPLYGGYYGLRNYAWDSRAETYLKNLRIERYFNMRIGAKRQFIDGKFQSENHYISDNWGFALGSRIKPYTEITDKRTVGTVYEVPTDDGMMYQENETGMRSFYTGRITNYRDFYATPIYETLDALSYIDMDYMLSQKDFKGLQTGFSLEYIIIRYRDKEENPDDENATKKAEKEMFKNYKGFDGEKTMMLWMQPHINESNSVEVPDAIKIIEVPNNDSTKRYTALKEERNLKILSAHNIITPEIIGMPPAKATGFSSQSEYLQAAFEHLHWAVIDPYRVLLLEDIQNLFFDAGIFVGVGIKSNPIHYLKLSEMILDNYYGTDEIRAKYGDGPISEEVAKEIANRNTTFSNTQNFE